MSDPTQMPGELPPELGANSEGARNSVNRPQGLLERLLDPASIHRLMIGSGGLAVFGLVVWLYSIGLFEDPLWAAVGLTSANLTLLAGGVMLAWRSPYKTAGRGMAMLACIVLPLNLWFYDAQGLVTLKDGGNLWIPAMVCCLLYAGVARLLRDSLFVYTFVAGVTLTGLLFLADADVGKFWEVVAPSALLVTVGTLAVHLERFFPKGESKEDAVLFAREDFGLAFFRAGHCVLGAGLLLLLLGRVAGWLYDPMLHSYGWFDRPDLATLFHAKLSALALILVGAYNYLYSRFTQESGRYFTYFAAVLGFWATVVGIDLFEVAVTPSLVMGLLAFLSLMGHLLARLNTNAEDAEADSDKTGVFTTFLNEVDDAAKPFGRLFSSAALLVGAGLYCLSAYGGEPLSNTFYPSMVLVLLSFVAGVRRPTEDSLGFPQHLDGFGLLSSLSLLLGSVVLKLSPEVYGLDLVVMLASPLVGLAFSYFATSQSLKQFYSAAAATVTAVLLFAYSPWLFMASASVNCLFYFFVGLLYLGAANVSGRGSYRYVAYLAHAVSVWQLVYVLNLGFYLPLAAVSVVGMLMVVFARLFDRENSSVYGQYAVLFANAAGCLLAANRLLVDEESFKLLIMAFVQALAAGGAMLFAKHENRNAGLAVVGIGSLLMSALTLNALSDLSMVQRFEMMFVAGGAFVLATGHVGWYRETDQRSGLVDLNLWVGSLLVAVPSVLSLLAMRLFGVSNEYWQFAHESGVLFAGLLLASTGVLCRLKSTTLVGSSMLLAYLGSLVFFVQVPEQLQNVAVYLMLGGGTVFAAAVLLSVYRDRLLAVTEQVKAKEGVFTVLNWR